MVIIVLTVIVVVVVVVTVVAVKDILRSLNKPQKMAVLKVCRLSVLTTY